MAQIISCSIDLSKIDKTKIVEGKGGAKYYDFDVITKDEKDQYGNDVSISQKQAADERKAKEKKIYIGRGKIVWSSPPNVPPPAKSETPYTDEMNTTNQKDDLPF